MFCTSFGVLITVVYTCQNAFGCTFKIYGGKWTGKITPIPIIRIRILMHFSKDSSKSEHYWACTVHQALDESLHVHPYLILITTLWCAFLGPPFYQWRNWGLEGLSNLTQNCQLRNDKDWNPSPSNLEGRKNNNIVTHAFLLTQQYPQQSVLGNELKTNPNRCVQGYKHIIINNSK